MSPFLISTHVLDTASGQPAAGLPVILGRLIDPSPDISPEWYELGAAVTDHNGRNRSFGPAAFHAGRYRLTFDTAAYFSLSSTQSFFPEIAVVFTVAADVQHYHLPLLLSPFAYSTYRGN